MAPIGDEATWAYYRTRPLGSRIGAWASHQSAVIASRAELEAQVAAVEERFAGVDPPLAAALGGYRLTPDVYEFWTHDDARLHDRSRVPPHRRRLGARAALAVAGASARAARRRTRSATLVREQHDARAARSALAAACSRMPDQP